MDSYTKITNGAERGREQKVSEPVQPYSANLRDSKFSDTLSTLVSIEDDLTPVSSPVSTDASVSCQPRTFLDEASFYHSALEDHVLTFVIDRNTVIQNISQPLCRLLNYEKERLLHQPWEVLQPRCKKCVNFDQVWASLDRGEKWEGEICFSHKNCDLIWLNVTFVPRCNESGSCDFVLAVCADLTASKRRLNLAQSIVESAVYNSETTTGLLGIDGEVLFFNKAALQRSSVKSANIIGKKIWETPWLQALEESQQQIKEKIQACRSGEPQFLQIEAWLNGSRSHVTVMLRPIVNNKGAISHLVLEGRDISLNLQVQHALQRSELKYKALADATKIGFAELDCSLRLLAANQQLVEMLGFSSLQELSRELSHTWIAASDLSLFEKALASCITTKKFQRLELNVQRTDGSVLPVEIFLAQLLLEGHQRLLCFVQDNNERKTAEQKLLLSEERLKLALAGSDAALWDWSPGAVADFQGAFDIGWKNILGYDKEDLFSDIASWRKYLHPWDHDRVLNSFTAALQNHSPMFEEEYRMRHKSGRWVWVLGRGKVMHRDKNGNPLRMVGTITDISEKKQAEEERLAMITQLRHADKMEALGLLSAGVAHDFNNILVSVLGYADLARNELSQSGNARLQHYVNQIVSSGERARELVRQLLRYSRNEPLNIVETNLAPLTREVKQLLAGTMPPSIQVILNLEEGCAAVRLDPILYLQVLINLCVNARDAIEDKGCITIRLYEMSPDSTVCSTCMANVTGSRVVVEVKDNGPGISEDIQQRVFDTFYTTKGDGNGTGIGLASVHRIMHELNGHVTLFSKPGEGTAFKLFFPASQ